MMLLSKKTQVGVLLIATVLTGCSTMEKLGIKNTPVSHNQASVIKPSRGVEYLSANKPLNEDFIGLPFLFDGDVVLSTKFDLAKWMSKRFISTEGKEYSVLDRYVIDMKKGTITSLHKDIEFKELQQHLLMKVLPLANQEGVPDKLVLSNLEEVDGRASVLVIEDPKTQKIHGFVESAFIKL